MRSIRTIAYDCETFVMFSLIESVIIVSWNIAILGVFWSNSRINHANQEHLKIYEDFGKTKNEDSRGPWRLLQWEELCSQVLRQVIWRRKPKNTKIRETRPRRSSHAPRAIQNWYMCPEHFKCEGRMRNFICFCGFIACFYPKPN